MKKCTVLWSNVPRCTLTQLEVQSCQRGVPTLGRREEQAQWLVCKVLLFSSPALKDSKYQFIRMGEVNVRLQPNTSMYAEREAATLCVNEGYRQRLQNLWVLCRGWNTTQQGHLGVPPSSTWLIAAARVHYNSPDGLSPHQQAITPTVIPYNRFHGSRPYSYSIFILLLHRPLCGWLHSQSGCHAKEIDDTILVSSSFMFSL